jgi:uncharacterized phage protein gp47/JayE
MASLNTETFTQIDNNAVTATQAASSTPLDLTVGSSLRAVIQAVAGVALWLQSLIVYVLTLTRAATSVGSDLDSWAADFAFTRLAAVAATGAVTFSRFTPTLQALIPVGSQVQTADGTQTFTVTADTTNPAYSASQNAFIVAAGVSSVTCLVTANTAGAGANVNANTVTVLTQAISGIDYCNNAGAIGVTPYVTGINAETDAAFRIRFVAYIASLSKATKTAIGAAINGVQANLYYSLTENYTYAGAYQLGYFYVVVDDGSGNPPGSLLTAISSAIDAVRPVTTTFGVYAPVVVTANVSMALVTLAGFVHATVVAQVVTALQSFINTLPVGSTLPYNQLAAVAFAVPGVNNVNSILLNSGTADLTITNQQVIKAGTVAVS